MLIASDVLAILAVLRVADADVWISGGWGVDALLGEQTREHQDLDLGFRAEQEAVVVAALARAGFVESLDWRPVRFVVGDAAGRDIDLHPLVFAAGGSAVQASLEAGKPFRYPAECFVTGHIGGETVPCLSVEQQVLFHQGYELRERDVADLARLRAAFGDRADF